MAAKTLADYAADYYRGLTPEGIRSSIQDMLVDDQKISVEELNKAFKGAGAWTDSGRQGQGRARASDVYFKDGIGEKFMDPNTNPHNRALSTYQMRELGLIDEAGNLKDTAVGYSRPGIAGEGEEYRYRDSSYKSFDELTPEEQQQKITEGFFQNADPRLQFISTAEKDKGLYGDIDLSSGYVDEAQVERLIQAAMNRQGAILGNTAQRKSDGIARYIPQVAAIAGTVFGIPAAAWLGSAASVGEGLQNENWGQAILGAAGMGNAMYPGFNPGRMINDQFGLSPTNPVGGALFRGGVAGLTGGNPMQSALSSVGSHYGSQFGAQIGDDGSLLSDIGRGVGGMVGGSIGGSLVGGTTGGSSGIAPIDTTVPYIPPETPARTVNTGALSGLNRYGTGGQRNFFN